MTQPRRPHRQQNRSHRPQKTPKGFAARREAVRLLDAIIIEKRPFDDIWPTALESAEMKAMADPDRALTRLIVMTTLRHRGHIDKILAMFLKNPLPQDAQTIQNILRSAVAQLLYLQSAPHAVLNIATSMAAQERAHLPFKGLINGVLRNYTRTEPEKFGEEEGSGNTPEWLFKRWKQQYGDHQAQQIALGHLNEPALDISVKGKADAQNWAEQLKGTLLPTGTIRVKNAGNPVKLPGFEQGEWWVQDAAAALPVRLLGDITGKHILDLCAAPGGKTAQLCAANATVTAVERSPQRMKRLAENLTRLNLKAELITADAGEFKPQTPPDGILLDAPCTATGTIRRHPDVPYLKTLKNITDLAKIQRTLLDHTASILKPGGTLVYCVCSLEHEEGEDQITGFLERHNNFSLEPILPSEFPGLEYVLLPRGDARTLPHYLSDLDEGLRGMDGFYIAKLKRAG